MTPYPNPTTTWHYIGEDTKRAIMFDARRRRERQARRISAMQGVPL